MIRLTERDKKHLLSLGYTQEKISIIEKSEFKYFSNFNRRVTEDCAIKSVGKRAWLTGIAIACFHASAVRDSKKGRSVVYIKRV